MTDATDETDEAKRAHELITSLRNDGYTVGYGTDVNDEFPEHVEQAREALADPDEISGYYLTVMTDGKADYYSSTVLGEPTPVALAQIQMLGSHFRSVLEATGLDTSTLVDAMVDEALAIDDVDDDQNHDDRDGESQEGSDHD